MASVYRHRDKWYLRYRDNRGQWRSKATSAQSKTEAKRMAQELGMRHERQRFGLEVTAFNCARRTGRWPGVNPVADVKPRRVPKRKPDFLRIDEVPRVLAAVPLRWRALFATAVYTGLRKGELLGLRKTDIDLSSRLIIVNRSYDLQRILRHSDPRITTETYGHLEPNYLRNEIDRLRFGTAPAESLSSDSHAVTSNRSQLVTTLLPLGGNRPSEPSNDSEIPEGFSAATSAGWTGLEPAASGVTGRRYNQA